MLQQANFKRDNYDRIKFERDDFERKIADLSTKNAAFEATLQVMTKERDDLTRGVIDLIIFYSHNSYPCWYSLIMI